MVHKLLYAAMIAAQSFDIGTTLHSRCPEAWWPNKPSAVVGKSAAVAVTLWLGPRVPAVGATAATIGIISGSLAGLHNLRTVCHE